MKIINKTKHILALIAFSILLNACDSYIEEDVFSNITAENFLTEDTADQLIVGLYTSMRGVYNNHNYQFAGTDVFTSRGEIFSFSAENDYNSFNAPQTNGLWNSNYNVISKANTAINRFEIEIDWSESRLDEKAYGIAQARALRAMSFFYLAQQFGGIVLDMEEPQSIRNDYTRSTEEETYATIISELEAAIPNLEDMPETGRISKRAAQHVLAEVYLTRAYKSFAGSNDFQTAADLAVQAIGSYDIRSQTFAQLFDYDNQVNPEILFAAQWGNTGFVQDRGNNKHSLFMTGVEQLPGISRNNSYGKSGDNLMPTPYFYSLFEDNDTREDVTMHRVLFADEPGFSVGADEIAVGDTIIYFPKEAIDMAELVDKLDRYWVYQPDQYLFGRPDEVGDVNYKYELNPNFTNFPIFKKFDDEIFQEEGLGARDTYVYRVAGTHLLAAEAFLGAGNTAQALFHLNRVRERATGIADHYSTIDLDVILAERALELAGEENRWAVLKRMGKLEERINIYNPHVVDHGAFDATKHLLRPIPVKELELSPGTMIQNPKY
ncbi:RagB/SusD family nutrient uptake outer membrane protein [Arenibacter sp. F26102]|uniref:RagB/SusD family nutrient uptake outer membrane protein n=1 Tax=Arenibacter sp. F26102 TaxID=2926416 RepID=UPI001FF31252|nr:RagB/SusD family nutrient uptake outer membrane protein [Arenibacter sp. F26102]MCK0145266.1 RagB/SusD family nutrient uptake outer membrane protein [Arenibacter sp. F26102]